MKKIILFSLFFTTFASADEAIINVKVGDRVSNFQVKPDGKDYSLTLRVNQFKKGQVLIGKKNYQHVIDQVKSVMVQQDKPVSCPARDHSSVEYKNETGKTSRTEFCYLDQGKQSTTIRALVDVMLMSL